MRSQYIEAAKLLRIPYWDWASRPTLPITVQTPTVVINVPTGTAEVENPLYDYNFHWGNEGNVFLNKSIPFDAFPWTVRNFNSTSRASDHAAANAKLLSNFGTVSAKVYQLFTDPSDYSTFSCMTANGVQNAANNIEVIHGNIHNSVGGEGHMTYPEVSAFDPIFWLHHANVDRLFAMWQILNPHSYIVPTVNNWGTYYESPGTIDTGTSSLAPFHADNGTSMWTSDTVRELAVFNYAYPELPDWALDATQLANYVRLQVNMKYNPAVTTTRKRPRRRALTDENVSAAFESLSYTELQDLRINNAAYQWTINIVVARFAYDTGFDLDFFIGSPPSDVRARATACNLVGTQSSFTGWNVAAMFPHGAPDGMAQGELSLTHALAAAVNRGYLADLSPETVVPVLQRQLTWRARLTNGCELDVAALKGLAISVGSKSTTPSPAQNAFPVYGKMSWHPEITRGKTGGACS